jgi:hypothetical protein
MRVKINQIENDLLHQIKRLDIICKSKGLPRPKKDHLQLSGNGGSQSRTGGTYVSPYTRNARVSPAGPAIRSGAAGSNSRGRMPAGAIPSKIGTTSNNS